MAKKNLYSNKHKNIIKASKDEIKAMDFTVGNGSFVRMNMTLYDDGKPLWGINIGPTMIYEELK